MPKGDLAIENGLLSALSELICPNEAPAIALEAEIRRRLNIEEAMVQSLMRTDAPGRPPGDIDRAVKELMDIAAPGAASY